MSACRRGCQTNFVALALYRSECQFRRLAPLHWLVKQRPDAAGVAACALSRRPCAEPDYPGAPKPFTLTLSRPPPDVVMRNDDLLSAVVAER
jgi:hypothetical protein